MRRRLAMLSAVLLGSTAAVLTPASPAAAGVHVCAGEGGANLGFGLTYPVTISPDLPPHIFHVKVHQPRKTNFIFSLFTGACVNTNAPTLKQTLTASGTWAGWCGLSTGYGTMLLGDNPRFGWIDIGGVLVITGEVVGIASAIPDTLAGHSCNGNVGASQFIISGGAVAFDHCATPKQHLPGLEGGGSLWVLLTLPGGTLTTVLMNTFLPLVAISAHTTTSLHIWTLFCVPMPVL